MRDNVRCLEMFVLTRPQVSVQFTLTLHTPSQKTAWQALTPALLLYTRAQRLRGADWVSGSRLHKRKAAAFSRLSPEALRPLRVWLLSWITWSNSKNFKRDVQKWIINLDDSLNWFIERSSENLRFQYLPGSIWTKNMKKHPQNSWKDWDFSPVWLLWSLLSLLAFLLNLSDLDAFQDQFRFVSAAETDLLCIPSSAAIDSCTQNNVQMQTAPTIARSNYVPITVQKLPHLLSIHPY